MESLDDAVKNASAVFLGTAVGPVTPVTGKDYSLQYFSVERGWKGTTGIKAQAKIGKTSCSVSFETNKKYLVFASDKGPIYTSGCSRTISADKATQTMLELGKSLPLK